MANVVWTDHAINDLDEIGNYIAVDSLLYAQITVEKLFNSVDILEKYPEIGVIVSEFNRQDLRELV